MNELQITDHFKLRELWSPDNYEILMAPLFWRHMELLEELRQAYGKWIIVNSGHRSDDHNAHVGGAPKSMHLEFATDIRPSGGGDSMGVELDNLYNLAKGLRFTGIGRYNTFLHLDRRDIIGRTPAEWDNR